MISTTSTEERVKIDTSLPFASVKAAVNLFGEKVKLLKIRKDIELKQELLKLEAQLANEEKRKEKALYELNQAKKLLELVLKSEEPNECIQESFINTKSKHGPGQTGSEVEVKHVIAETQPLTTNEHRPTIMDSEWKEHLEMLTDLKSELLAVTKERDAAIDLREKTVPSIQLKEQKIQDLLKEITAINESLVLLNLAHMEANKEKVALLELNHTNNGRAEQSKLADEDLRRTELEHKLAKATKEISGLQSELTSVKEDEIKVSAAARGTINDLEELKSELQKATMSAGTASASLLTLRHELDELKLNLQKELDNITTIGETQKSIQNELDITRKDLKNVREREHNAATVASTLERELVNIREELPAAVEAQEIAVKSISNLSQVFEQVKAEATSAKLEAEAIHNEALKMKNDAEQAKPAREHAENMLKQALQEFEAAKSAESTALDRVKSLSMKGYGSRSSGTENNAGIIISLNEYESLKRKVRESEELANMKVIAAMAQIEAVKVSEQEVMHKLAMVMEDLDNTRAASKEAVRQVEMAEAAKSAVETELKVLGGREQKYRQKEMAMVSHQLYEKNGNENRQSLPVRLSGPLGELLSKDSELGLRHLLVTTDDYASGSSLRKRIPHRVEK